LAVVEHLKQLADEKRATPSQLAIAWLLAQGDDIVPIPGAERRRYLEENARALEVRLTRRTWPSSRRCLRMGWLLGNATGQRG
jgi:aryl-alcohol dehydrogenase-like predicted oxidoreductase